jgi:hypothetical protein
MMSMAEERESRRCGRRAEAGRGAVLVDEESKKEIKIGEGRQRWSPSDLMMMVMM